MAYEISLGTWYRHVFQVADGMSVLPSVVSPMLTYRGVADDQEGNSWTMSFSSNEGAVAQLVCVTEEAFVGYCEVMSAFVLPIKRKSHVYNSIPVEARLSVASLLDYYGFEQ